MVESNKEGELNEVGVEVKDDDDDVDDDDEVEGGQD